MASTHRCLWSHRETVLAFKDRLSQNWMLTRMPSKPWSLVQTLWTHLPHSLSPPYQSLSTTNFWWVEQNKSFHWIFDKGIWIICLQAWKEYQQTIDVFRSTLSVWLHFYSSVKGHLYVLQYFHDTVNIQSFELKALNKTKQLLHKVYEF